MEVRLPAGKLHTLQALVESFATRQSCTRRDLESLLGSLGHACRVVKQGKTFLRRLFELLAVSRQAHHYVRLNAAACSDVLVDGVPISVKPCVLHTAPLASPGSVHLCYRCIRFSRLWGHKAPNNNLKVILNHIHQL